MLSDDDCVHRLCEQLQEQYKVQPSSKTPLEQALSLITQLQESPCNHLAPFKYRLPNFLGEYPIHSRKLTVKSNNLINSLKHIMLMIMPKS